MSEERRRGKSRRGEALLFLKQQQAQNSTGARDDSTAIQRLPRSPPSAKPLRACSIVASSDIIIISIITCASSVFYRLQEKSRLATSSFVSTATATHSIPSKSTPRPAVQPSILNHLPRTPPKSCPLAAPPSRTFRSTSHRRRCWATATIQAPPRASAQTPFALRLVIPPEISRLFTVIC